MVQKQALLVIDPLEHLRSLSEQRLLAASSPTVGLRLSVPLLLPTDQMLSGACLQIQALTEIIIMTIKAELLMSIRSLDPGRAPGSVFKLVCRAVPCRARNAAFLYLLTLGADLPC